MGENGDDQLSASADASGTSGDQGNHAGSAIALGNSPSLGNSQTSSESSTQDEHFAPERAFTERASSGEEDSSTPGVYVQDRGDTLAEAGSTDQDSTIPVRARSHEISF